MVVGQEIERHRRYFCQQLVERRCVGSSRDVVAMSRPHRRLVVPCGGDREDERFRHSWHSLLAVFEKNPITIRKTERCLWRRQKRSVSCLANKKGRLARSRP